MSLRNAKLENELGEIRASLPKMVEFIQGDTMKTMEELSKRFYEQEQRYEQITDELEEANLLKRK